MPTSLTRWYNDGSLTRSFLLALVNAEYFDTTGDMTDILEHPQRYNATFQAWEELDYPTESDENWDEFINAITDTEESDETDDN